MKYFEVTGKSAINYVRERDLESVLCKCRGRLKIDRTDPPEECYGFVVYRLVCQKCGGAYGARELSRYAALRMGLITKEGASNAET